jgi:hypothetical protein
VSENYELVGYVGEARGDESTIVQAQPVLQHEGVLYAPTSRDWSNDDLMRIGDDRHAAIRRFRTSKPRKIVEGQNVWVAGPTFVTRLLATPEIGSVTRGIHAWETEERGFRIRVGFAREFQEMVYGLANSITPVLYRCIFDPLERSTGEAKRVYQLYAALPLDRSPSREVNRALYFESVMDHYAMAFVKKQALAFSVFDSDEEYEEALSAKRREMTAEHIGSGEYVPLREPEFSRPTKTLDLLREALEKKKALDVRR